MERTVQEQTQRVEGVLREIDLDERTFIVRNFDRNDEVRCHIPEPAEGLLEIAKAALDYHVIVVGTRQHDPGKRRSIPLRAREIEIVGKNLEDSFRQPSLVEST